MKPGSHVTSTQEEMLHIYSQSHTDKRLVEASQILVTSAPVSCSAGNLSSSESVFTSMQVKVHTVDVDDG